MYGKKYHSNNAGFTLIELLIVFSISALIVLPAVVGYVSYTNNQVFSNAVQEVKTDIALAQSRAQSQVKPSQFSACTTNALTNYTFLLCPTGGGSCPSCLSTKTYEVDVTCGTTSYTVASNNLPSGVSFANKTSSCFTFLPLDTTVVGSGSFDIQMGTQKKTVTVQNTGILQIQ